MITEIAIGLCIVCIVYILYLSNELKKMKTERNLKMSIEPEALDGGRVDLLWRDADGKPYETALGLPSNVEMKEANFDKNSFTFTFATV
jgi:hypothetical protein